MFGIFWIFLVFNVCIFETEELHYEDGTFFKYKIIFASKPELLQSNKETISVKLRGTDFECMFDNEEDLLSRYSLDLSVHYFDSVLSRMPPLRIFSDNWIYYIHPRKQINQSLIWNRSETYNLGFYNHSYFTGHKIKAFSDKEQLYFTQVYVNGTICKTTGHPRKTEIFYICSQTETEEIRNLYETSSCSYVFHVYTPRVCSGYGFDNKFVHPIHCYTDFNWNEWIAFLCDFYSPTRVTKKVTIKIVKDKYYNIYGDLFMLVSSKSIASDIKELSDEEFLMKVIDLYHKILDAEVVEKENVDKSENIEGDDFVLVSSKSVASKTKGLSEEEFLMKLIGLYNKKLDTEVVEKESIDKSENIDGDDFVLVSSKSVASNTKQLSDEEFLMKLIGLYHKKLDTEVVEQESIDKSENIDGDNFVLVSSKSVASNTKQQSDEEFLMKLIGLYYKRPDTEVIEKESVDKSENIEGDNFVLVSLKSVASNTKELSYEEFLMKLIGLYYKMLDTEVVEKESVDKSENIDGDSFVLVSSKSVASNTKELSDEEFLKQLIGLL